ncbi:hypothetical protein [Streptomyces sp. NPDC058657]|uniref:hypothetical protein n=1 Tax=unclassified Streptomyces TaxID=2593676 RepID=UPI00365C9EC9
MYKRLLHSVLALSFSAGVLFAAMGGGDLVWDSAPASVAAQADRVLPPDLVWDLAPVSKDA